jgi:hypothetical protein
LNGRTYLVAPCRVIHVAEKLAGLTSTACRTKLRCRCSAWCINLLHIFLRKKQWCRVRPSFVPTRNLLFDALVGSVVGLVNFAGFRRMMMDTTGCLVPTEFECCLII